MPTAGARACFARRERVAKPARPGDSSQDQRVGYRDADELRDFGADAVVIVTNGDRKTRWAEKRELERARAELEIPVIHVAM